MFGVSIPELLLILAIALIVLGPKKLPELAKSLGRGIAEFRKATSEIKDSINFDDELNTIKSNFSDIGNNMDPPIMSEEKSDKPFETDTYTSNDARDTADPDKEKAKDVKNNG